MTTEQQNSAFQDKFSHFWKLGIEDRDECRVDGRLLRRGQCRLEQMFGQDATESQEIDLGE